jgi:hypothetical protein
MMRNENSVANATPRDIFSSFRHDAGCLVPEDFWRFGDAVPFGHVASTYAACHDLKQHFILADLWDGHFLNADIMVVVVDGGKQDVSPRKKKNLQI